MKTPNPTPTAAALAAPQVQAVEAVDTETGEVFTPSFAFKYLQGHPRQYRFDAKEGQFNINGTDKLGPSLTFQPIAWRIFNDNILQLGTKRWAELFFVDENKCVSSLLFHGYSVDNIMRLIEPLFYADLTLADVIITATAERKENTKIQPKGVYFIASFTYQPADREQAQLLGRFVEKERIYRAETLTDRAEILAAHGYYNPLGESDELPPQLAAAA